jgi:hypothetical protein
MSPRGVRDGTRGGSDRIGTEIGSRPRDLSHGGVVEEQKNIRKKGL